MNKFEQCLNNDIKNIMDNGFGKVSKSVMTDKNLSIEAKGIYAYLCTFAGHDNVAFPSKSKILTDLKISENRYYKHRQQLIDAGYLTINVFVDKNTNFKRTTFFINQNKNNHQNKNKQELNNYSQKIVDKKKVKKINLNKDMQNFAQKQNLQNKGEGDIQNKGHKINNIKLTNILDTIDTNNSNSSNLDELLFDAQKSKLCLDDNTLDLLKIFCVDNLNQFDINLAQKTIDSIFKAKKLAEEELVKENILTKQQLIKNNRSYYALDFENIDFYTYFKRILYTLKTKSKINNRSSYFFVSTKNLFKELILADLYINNPKEIKVKVPIYD